MKNRGFCFKLISFGALAAAAMIFPIFAARAEEKPPQTIPPAEIDPIVKASAYGDKLTWSYHGSQPLPWSLFKPNDFSTIPVKFDGTGVRSLGNVPPPGVHPRIFFSPEDLPAIRKRIKETRAGQEAWKNLLCYTNTLKLTYDENADYAKPDWLHGDFFVHGRCPVFLTHNYDKNREDFYAILAEGKKPEKDCSKFIPLASVEALRCLIDDDAEAAKTLARAVVTAVKLEQERRREKDKPVEPGQPPNPSTSRLDAICLGMAYDFIFNWLTAEQKKIVHDELVTLSAWHDNYGSFNNAESSRSNWASFSYWAFDLLAIEGEPGFNDLKFRGLYRGWRNFITTSYFDSGAIFEGEGKSLLGLDALAGFDRLAEKYNLEPLFHHPAIRRHYGNFTASSILPTRDKFAIFDMLGGMGGGLCTPVDVVVAHYLYPDDKRIDFVYRAVVGDDYSHLPNRCDWTWNMVVICALFATDYNPANTPEALGLPFTFFCGQRALMMTRSSWDTDATFLTMHVRGASGGHPYRDRNGIMLSAKGRPWVTIPWDGGQDAGWKCNTVLIDGREQSNSTPGRVVDFVDQPLASFLVGDAKYCWDWVWRTTSRTKDGKPATRADVLAGNLDTGGGWTPVEQSFNDFAWTKNPGLSYTQPLKLMPDWIAPNGVISAYVKQVNTPVIKSFRTAGVVRGPRPYVLVVDDIQRNCLPARYDWNLQLSPDVVPVKVPLPFAMQGDIVLTGSASLSPEGKLKPGEPALLVRLLDCHGQAAPADLKVRDKINLLTLSTRAVSPELKVLLYAFRGGDPLPLTTWNLKRNRLAVEFNEQRDLIDFHSAASGKTDISIYRNRREIVAVNHPLTKLADPETDRLDKEIAQLPATLASLKNFNPDRLPGLLASWSFDAIQNGGFPAGQPGVPAISASGAAIEPGRISGAARFPATGVEVKMNLKGKITTGYTVSFWIKSDPGPRGNFVDFNFLNLFSLDMVQEWCRFNAQGQWFYGGTNNASMLGDWTHFAVTCDGKTLVLYRDGRPLMTLPGERKLEAPDSFSLGRDGFQGAYDDLRIYDRALDRETIEQIYLFGDQAGGR